HVLAAARNRESRIAQHLDRNRRGLLASHLNIRGLNWTPGDGAQKWQTLNDWVASRSILLRERNRQRGRHNPESGRSRIDQDIGDRLAIGGARNTERDTGEHSVGVVSFRTTVDRNRHDVLTGSRNPARFSAAGASAPPCPQTGAA